MNRQLKSGPGWRLGWDTSAPEFKALVGGDTWAVELTGAEFKDFCQLLEQLMETLEQIKSELMDEEAITCEAESALLWMEVQGYPQAYNLSFISLKGRRVEGQWPATAVAQLAQAAQVLKVF
ncbi:MAG TPA: DUF1818 family protein [Candidatus Caenarcaniphilales bacterium]